MSISKEYIVNTEAKAGTEKDKSFVFETKEEYITHLIRNHQIQKNGSYHKDGCIHLKGVLKIDSRVKKGLDWSDIVATNAIVEDGVISKYKYLPKTVKGVKTTLPIPSLDLYILHNNYGCTKSDKHYCLDTLRISEQASLLDFSSVRAKLTLFYGRKIGLSKLPQSEVILGLGVSHLEIDCKDAYHVAKQKGCGKEVLDFLRPRSPIVTYISRFIGKKI